MSFVSLHFVLFLPIVFALFWLAPKKYQWVVMLISSYYFYMSWNAAYLLLIVITTFVTWIGAILLEKARQKYQKGLIVFACLFVCLSILFIFKYWNFTLEAISSVFGSFGYGVHPKTLDLLLPVGISFYTFQTIGYLIDVKRGDIVAEYNFGKYAAFISFFPQLVAGPIERSRNLLPQIKEAHKFTYENGIMGLRQMLWGFFKKIVIADTLAVYSDNVFNNVYAFRGGGISPSRFDFYISDLMFFLRLFRYRHWNGKTLRGQPDDQF